MHSNIKTLVPVILSGGMGTRLWPMSRGSYPKQFLSLNSEEHCLIQETVLKLKGDTRFATPVIVCNSEHRFLVAEKMRQIGIVNPDIILEPIGRNTAPAIAVAAHYVKDKYDDDACILVLPSDHIITDTNAFLEGAMAAFETAQQGHLVTFGIHPEYAETGYGYIKLGSSLNQNSSAYTVDRFVEKPDEAAAQDYVNSGEYVWNSGMFCFPAGLFLEELKSFDSDMTQKVNQVINLRKTSDDFITLNEEIFASIRGESVDYAVMENTKKAAVVLLSCGWSDVGSWDALWRMKDKDENNNVLCEQTYAMDTTDCYVSCEDGVRVATLGVKDLVIISTKDIVMVADKNRAQDVKKLVTEVKTKSKELVENHRQVYRPWGYYDSIDSGARHQVKRIVVNPGEQLSLQMHYHRAEHWIVVSGTAIVTKDESVQTVTENQSVYIPFGAKHRLENPGKIPLELIEVQSGSYLGEDDIVRFADEYGRSAPKEQIKEKAAHA